ncbi:MAG: hypothetical protein R6V44_09300 [Paracoccaceae bacterium]
MTTPPAVRRSPPDRGRDAEQAREFRAAVLRVGDRGEKEAEEARDRRRRLQALGHVPSRFVGDPLDLLEAAHVVLGGGGLSTMLRCRGRRGGDGAD